MADDKKTPDVLPAPAAEKTTTTGSGSTQKYVGPVPAPLIGNLPIDLKQPRLGYLHQKVPANELPEQYIEYVKDTVAGAKDWWK